MYNHHNDKVGKMRPKGGVYKVMHDDDLKVWMKMWLLGMMPREIKKLYPTLTGNRMTHQIYYHIKRIQGPFMSEVLSIFSDGGTRALMREYNLDVFKANRLQRLCYYHDKNPLTAGGRQKKKI